MYVLQIRLWLELQLELGLGLDYQTLGLSNPRINESSDCRPIINIANANLTDFPCSSATSI